MRAHLLIEACILQWPLFGGLYTFVKAQSGQLTLIQIPQLSSLWSSSLALSLRGLVKVEGII